MSDVLMRCPACDFERMSDGGRAPLHCERWMVPVNEAPGLPDCAETVFSGMVRCHRKSGHAGMHRAGDVQWQWRPRES